MSIHFRVIHCGNNIGCMFFLSVPKIALRVIQFYRLVLAEKHISPFKFSWIMYMAVKVMKDLQRN